MGCLAILMLQHLSGGALGLVIRRVWNPAHARCADGHTVCVRSSRRLSLRVDAHRPVVQRESVEESILRILLTERLISTCLGFCCARCSLSDLGALAYLLNTWSTSRIELPSAVYEKSASHQRAGLVLFVLTARSRRGLGMSLDPNGSRLSSGCFRRAWTLSSFAFVIA